MPVPSAAADEEEKETRETRGKQMSLAQAANAKSRNNKKPEKSCKSLKEISAVVVETFTAAKSKAISECGRILRIESEHVFGGGGLAPLVGRPPGLRHALAHVGDGGADGAIPLTRFGTE